MKRTIITLAAIAAFLSCQKDTAVSEEKQSAEERNTFTASIVSTKTSLDSSTGKVTWEKGDEITINDETFSTKTSGGTVTFTAEDECSLDSPYSAYYPDSYSTALPPTQTYSATASNLPLYAYSETHTLSFNNICAALGVKVKSADFASVKSIRVSCTNIGLCGAYDVTDSKAVLKNSDNKEVILVCEDAVTTTESGTTFYIAVPEGNYEGLKIELSADGSSYTKTMTARKNSIGIEANTLYEWSFTPQGTYLLVDSPTVSTML